MKTKNIRFLFLIGFVFNSLLFPYSNVTAQSGKIPPFRILQSNGKVFKAENLPMGKPIVIIYFSPDCEHCQTFMKQLFKRASDFKKASLAMITYLPMEKVSKFVTDKKVSRYSNITVGTEGASFFVRNYYRIIDMPFVALYDKEGRLICSYQKDIPLNDLVNRLKKLK